MEKNRHKAAVFAQWKYGHTRTYEGASAEKIFESLAPHQKQVCRMAVNDIMAASDEREIQHKNNCEIMQTGAPICTCEAAEAPK